MSHDCVKRINEQLAEHNTQLSPVISFGKGPELIQLSTTKAKADVRKKPVAMFCSYCPFCGIRLSKDE